MYCRMSVARALFFGGFLYPLGFIFVIAGGPIALWNGLNRPLDG